MKDVVPFVVRHQGAVSFSSTEGYMLRGGEGAACFYLDPDERAYVDSSTTSDSGCLVLHIVSPEGTGWTVIEFTGFPGWRLHSSRGGKVISVALVQP